MSTTTINGTSSASYLRSAGETVDSLLDAVRRNAVALCAETDRLPSRVRVTAGDVAVELYWPEPESGIGAIDGERPQAASVPVQRVPVVTAAGPVPEAVPGQPHDTAEGTPGENLVHITAPTVGTFYRAAEPGAKPFVGEGDTVTAGQQVAIIEVMKLMIPVEADQPGRIVEVIQPDAAAVEFGQRLFSIALADRVTT
ncbi:biotin/lipoyl-containing protein [Frankia sp. CiP3]|uniref:acetyl-CoA carboxylase biotin carboxyl carrier protein n=1 Tax=Frankia sp. CiP3 TaxID=2880971 RepID=UPI001EF4297B|nr:biotin/lipoyl-containing protein [Frankia sp. CiP3]